LSGCAAVNALWAMHRRVGASKKSPASMGIGPGRDGCRPRRCIAKWLFALIVDTLNDIDKISAPHALCVLLQNSPAAAGCRTARQ